MGIRVVSDQLRPSVEVDMTMSFAEHPGSNRQSYQTTYTLPAASISADGSAGARSDPPTSELMFCATSTTRLQLAPPSVDLNASTEASKQSSMGTMTVPLGWTTGCPPMTHALSGVVFAAPHVRPPSVEVLIWTRFRLVKSSNSV